MVITISVRAGARQEFQIQYNAPGKQLENPVRKNRHSLFHEHPRSRKHMVDPCEIIGGKGGGLTEVKLAHGMR